MKSNKVLKNPESIENLPDVNEPHFTEKLHTPEDGLILSNDKRKTFVLKSSNITKEIEPDYSSKIDKEFIPECQDRVNKISDVETLLSSEKNKRKTFVKKSNNNTVLHQNDKTIEHLESFPIKECAINLEPIENCEDNDQRQNKKSSFDVLHSETLTDTTIKDIQISVESPSKVKKNSTDSLHNNISDILSKEKKIDNKITATNEPNDDMQETEKIAENSKSKVDSDVPDQTAAKGKEKNFDIMNEVVVNNDESQKVQNINEIPECSSFKTPNSLLESSDSELDLMIIDEVGCDNQSAFRTTPIRRRIPRNSQKKKNFVFNKRKSVFKNHLSSEILNCEINNSCQKNIDTSLSDMNTVKNSEVDLNILRQGNVIAESNTDSIKISSQANTARKKYKKTSGKKIEGDENKLIKNTKKNSTKVKKIKNVKKNESDIEIDDLISKPKKSRRKKKNEDINGDDVISKFVEVDKGVKLKNVKETGKKLESDYPCKKTGENTFLVKADIHPPPPSFNTSYDNIIKKVDDQNFQNRQLAVVLDDVLKSKDIENLNISNRDILESNRTDCVKLNFSDSSSSFVIDPDESIEKLRCDSLPETDYCNLNCDEILDNGSSEVPNNPVLNTGNILCLNNNYYFQRCCFSADEQISTLLFLLFIKQTGILS